jgi:hypothetical protein
VSSDASGFDGTPPGHDQEHHASNGKSNAEGMPPGHGHEDERHERHIAHEADRETSSGTPDPDQTPPGQAEDHRDISEDWSDHSLPEKSGQETALEPLPHSAADDPYMSLVPQDHQDSSVAQSGIEVYLTGIGVDPAGVQAIDPQTLAQADIIDLNESVAFGSDEHRDSREGGDGHADGSDGLDEHVVDMAPPEPPPDNWQQHG